MKLDNRRLKEALTLGAGLRLPNLARPAEVAPSCATAPALVQAAALCLRPGPGDKPHLLLVNTLTTRRWILPKGWPIKGMTLAEAAAAEAWEEGGVRGTIATSPIGSFRYRKIRKNGLTLDCQADVFVLIVDSMSDTFPESNLRARCWVSPGEAATLVAEPDLRALLAQL